MKRDNGERPDTSKSSPEHAPDVVHAVDDLAGASENRAGRRIEVFIKGNIHCVERASVFCHIFSSIGCLNEQVRTLPGRYSSIIASVTTSSNANPSMPGRRSFFPR